MLSADGAGGQAEPAEYELVGAKNNRAADSLSLCQRPGLFGFRRLKHTQAMCQSLESADV
jgi:hypothetical protein